MLSNKASRAQKARRERESDARLQTKIRELKTNAEFMTVAEELGYAEDQTALSLAAVWPDPIERIRAYAEARAPRAEVNTKPAPVSFEAPPPTKPAITVAPVPSRPAWETQPARALPPLPPTTPARRPAAQPKPEQPEEPEPPSKGMPVIEYSGGQLPFATDEAERIIAESDDELFQRGGEFLVRVGFNEEIATAHGGKTKGPRLVRVQHMHLQERLTRYIDFKKIRRALEEVEVHQLSTGCRDGAVAAQRTLAPHTRHRWSRDGANDSRRWLDP
jgi:hypothetical protein